ncbi:hypothetical protein QBC41DRAFT_362333 [Cercophora samala]|uniref:CCHC-type domain-containing protein n=1 Tax=Cercophora samala TaxID=330535 RepID=A0AA40DGI9_9PEZI|nr:hypothetical protein QBC41DRAFT_362333 [Cercophora samala]
MAKNKKKNQGQGEPPLGDFRKCPSARKLFEFLGRAFPVKVNKQRTLNSFVIWLIERLIDKDVSDPSSAKAELKEWYQLLKSCRIDDQTIIEGYVELVQTHVSDHPLDARRLHIMEAGLRELMKNPASSQLPSKASTAQKSGARAPALVKAADHYTRPNRSLPVRKAQNSSGTLSKPMDGLIHPDRRVSAPTTIVSSATGSSKSSSDYIHPSRRVSVPPALTESTATREPDMSDYIHPGRRALVKTAQEPLKPDSSTPTFAHMHPDRTASVSIGHSSSPAPEIMYGHMHPDRMKVSREAAPEPGELIEKDNQDAECTRTRTGSRGKLEKLDPSCPDLPFASGANVMALEHLAAEKKWEKQGGKDTDLSFLTGSNRMVFGHDWALARKKRKATQTEPILDYGESPVDFGGAKSAVKDGKDFMIPENYVCNRCNIRGHLIQDCPTNGDWRFAIKAPEEYTCNFCGKQAEHYIDDCPRRPSKGLRNFQDEQDPPRRVVSDSIRNPVIDSYRPEPRSHKRHRSVDSELDEVDYSAPRSYRGRKKGRKSQRVDDQPERALSIRGRASTNDDRDPWGDLKPVVIGGYIDPDKPVGDEPPAQVYADRKYLVISPDPREEGRLSFYDVLSDDAKPKKSTLKKRKLSKKAQQAAPKAENPPIRIASTPLRVRVGIREVSQLIEEESVKNDLIPSFFKMFLDKEVHCRTKAKRPAALDFIEMPSESEESDDDVMEIDQTQDFVKNEQGDMSAQLKSRLSLGPSVNEPEQAANVSVIQHLHGVIDVDDDVVMTEARPSVIVSGWGDVTDLTELSDGDSQSHIVVVDD